MAINNDVKTPSAKAGQTAPGTVAGAGLDAREEVRGAHGLAQLLGHDGGGVYGQLLGDVSAATLRIEITWRKPNRVVACKCCLVTVACSTDRAIAERAPGVIKWQHSDPLRNGCGGCAAVKVGKRVSSARVAALVCYGFGSCLSRRGVGCAIFKIQNNLPGLRQPTRAPVADNVLGNTKLTGKASDATGAIYRCFK